MKNSHCSTSIQMLVIRNIVMGLEQIRGTKIVMRVVD